MLKFKSTTNYYKNILQLTIIGLLIYMVVRLFVDADYFADFEAYCPFGGMMALSSFLTSNTLACSMTETQIIMGLGLIFGVIVMSKLFCSYLCPLGTLTEWLGKLGDKFKVRYTITGISDRILRSLKYILLFITFYFTVSSSELFCKEYDPFYAIFSGFGHDVVVMYALPAIIIMILGAIFIRQFWCKYLCPLSAATNIFTFTIMFVAIMAVYLILLQFDLEISWVWPLAVICVSGFVMETIRLKSWVFPPFKITRDIDFCTDCKDCNKACPMGIKVSESNTISHIDCHLCGDCLYSCPEKNVLHINKKEMKWLPAITTVVLIIIALFLTTTVELPTINQKWGNNDQINKAGIFSQSGLKNIKCYGSSMSFASKMRRIPGILGVETYVQSHTVKVYYDTSRFNDDKVKKSIFTATKTLLRKPNAEINSLSIAMIGIDKLFDTYDSFYLQQLLKQNKGIYGIQTEYGEPVYTKLYFNPGEITKNKFKSIIESEELTYKSRGKDVTVPLKFEVAFLKDSVEIISKRDFMKKMFKSYSQVFNNYKNYKKDELSIYRISMPQAMNPSLRRSISYLVSHISTDSSVVRFSTNYLKEPVADIYFVTGKIDKKEIYSSLIDDTITVHFRGGKTGKVINPFNFPNKGNVLE